MKISKKKWVICAIIAVVLASVSAYLVWLNVQYNKTEYTTMSWLADGYRPTIPLPKGVRLDLASAETVKFKTKKSESEILKYYDNYFSTLKKVSRVDDSSKVAYYDENTRLVIYPLEIYKSDGFTYFLIVHNVYSEEYWNES